MSPVKESVWEFAMTAWELLCDFTRYFWERLKKLDGYRIAVLCMLPIALALLLFMLIANPGNVLVAEWYLDLLIVIAFVSTQVAAASYIGRFVDFCAAFINRAKIDDSPVGIWERIGTILGALIGLSIGITLAVLSTVVPFGGTLFLVAKIIFSLTHMARFAGLFNRVFSCFDDNPRLKSEKIIMGAAAVIGLIVAGFLLASATASLVGVISTTAIATGGIALPLWLAVFIFTCSFVSTVTSFGDYSSRAITYIRSFFETDRTLLSAVKTSLHQYRGAFIGVATGFTIGGIIVTALALTQPHLFVGLVGAIAAALIIITAVAIVGSLFSRAGDLVGRFIAKTEAASIPGSSNYNINYGLAYAPVPTSAASPKSDESNSKQPVKPPRTSATASSNSSWNWLPFFNTPRESTTSSQSARPVARPGKHA